MKITHVIPDISNKSGGTAVYIQSLLNKLDSPQLKNTLLCHKSNDSLPINDHIEICEVNSEKITNGYSSEFLKQLKSTECTICLLYTSDAADD